MKKAFTSTIICLFFFTARSQYGPVFFIDTLQDAAISRIGCADFNHDGKEDILTSNLHWPKDYLQLYVQSGDQQFEQQAMPGVDSFFNFECFVTGDILKDGWTDFVTASEFPSEITLYENDHGSFIPHLVADSLDITSAVLLADFNQDQILDILALQHTEIVVYLAIAEGVFDTPRVIHSGTEFYAIDTGHYNEDAFLDVSVASDGFDILLNDGQANFELIESPHIGLTFRLQSADLDGDTDIDIAAHESLRGILFFANDGQGHFLFEDTILQSTDIFDTYQLDDMDCDGDIDVFTTIPQIGLVIKVPNDGTGFFTEYEEIHFQSGELVRAVDLGDLDHDDTPDPVWGYFTLGARLNTCTSVAIEENRNSPGTLLLYPNPASGPVKISNTCNHSVLITVFDAIGNVMIHDKSIPASGEYQIEPGMPGVYFLKYRYENGDTEVKTFLVIPD